MQVLPVSLFLLYVRKLAKFPTSMRSELFQGIIMVALTITHSVKDYIEDVFSTLKNS